MKQPHPRGDQHYTRRHPEKVKRGTAAPGAKLTPPQILLVYAAVDGGANHSVLARALGVSRQTIWRHLKARET